MAIASKLKNAAAVVTSIGAIGAGAYALDERHASQEEFNAFRSSARVSTILELAKESEQAGGPDWLCKAIDEEIIALCSEIPDHYLCRPGSDAVEKLKEKAGCD